MKKIMIIIGICILSAVVFTGCINGNLSNQTPTVSMAQSGEEILITAVTNGPIECSNCTVIFINQTTSLEEGTPTLDCSNGDPNNVDAGDSISITGLLGDPGQTYTVQLKYDNETIGTCIYTIVGSTPTISMAQSGSTIIIQAVSNGPIPGASATATFINTSDTSQTYTGTINYDQGTSPTNIDAGDTITPPTQVTNSPDGQTWTCTITYNGDVIGTTIYTSTGPPPTPTISMAQVGNSITILAIEDGPVAINDVTITVVNASGINSTTAAPTYNDNDADGNVSAADLITFSAEFLAEDHSTDIPYSVKLIYNANIIGTASFTPS